MKNKLGTFSFVSLVMVLMLLFIAVVPGFATPAPAHLQDASWCQPPTDQPTVTPVPTDEPTPTSTPVPFCWVRTFGELFHLIGPNGESGWLASYQTWDQAGVKPPDGVSGSSYIIPRTEAQQRCLGFIAKDAPFGMAITIDCTGHVNITTTRCEGGGTCVAVGEGTVNGYTGESEGHIAP